MKYKLILLLLAGLVTFPSLHAQEAPWQDESLDASVRARDLVSRLTTEEKISLLRATSPGIPRLGIPKYYHGNEALHGIVRPGRFTVFPQAIGLGATWNPDLVHAVAAAASDEARARWNALSHGRDQTERFSDLLTFWSPTVNMARDPRWGRTPETYGEDPFLTGRIGVAFVTGLQGDDPKYVKVVSTPKHFAANNEEHNRAQCDARISEKMLREYYLPAYEACVREGHAQSIMTAYNAVNGVPCTVNPWLIGKVLRGEWGFDGYVVSDCGAPELVVTAHQYVKRPETSAALCLKAGLDLECGDKIYMEPLEEALRLGMVSTADIDSAAFRVLRARMRLGFFDAVGHNPYDALGPEVIGSPEHQQLALEAARQAIVLLKNEKNILPLRPDRLRRIAVVGNNAAQCVFGDYSGTPVVEPVSILEGIRRRVGPGTEVVSVPWKQTARREGRRGRGGQSAEAFYNGSREALEALEKNTVVSVGEDPFAEAVAAARESDVVIAVMGTDMSIERETRDRESIELPEDQQRFLKELYAVNRKVILVLVAGSPVALNWEDIHLPAIVDVWYSGESGGTAAAEVLFGDCNPGGRLPLTFYRSLDDLPAFDDYDVSKGRTYQYFDGDPLYPFGYGLSYTTFRYSGLSVQDGDGAVTVRFRVRNTGRRDGDEVAQLYVRLPEGSGSAQPLRQLKGFRRVNIPAGKTREITLTVPKEQLRYWDERKGDYVYPSGEYLFMAGASSADGRLLQTAFIRGLER